MVTASAIELTVATVTTDGVVVLVGALALHVITDTGATLPLASGAYIAGWRMIGAGEAGADL